MEKMHLGIMADCSRNAVLSVDGVKRLIDCLQKMGYNTLMLYTEDTYEVNDQPLFGYLRGKYTKTELKELVKYGKEHGVELIPCIQTLAHLNQMFRWSEYQDIRDCDDILLVGEEKTYRLIEDMIRSVRECFDTDIIHLGMDEAHNLGNGKYKQLHGETDRLEILKGHLDKVTDIAKKYGFKPIIWSDMFFSLAKRARNDYSWYYTDDPDIITPEIAATVPEGLGLTYWDYYADDKSRYDNMLEAHLRFDHPVWFGGGAWTWAGFAPHNRMSVRRTRTAMQSCREKGIKNIFLTCWGDNGGEATVFSVLPTLFYAAEVYRGNEDESSIHKKFKETFGIDFDDFMKLDLPAVPSPECADSTDSFDITLLYSDPFLGWTDSVIKSRFPNAERLYEEYAAELAKLQNNDEFGYMFRASSAMCSLLAVKSTLGIRTREAYKSGDKKAIKELTDRYKEAEKRAADFYNAYRDAWYHDKKGSGFEVQDIRLGGLIFRLADCRKRLESYLDGSISAIDELEENPVDIPIGGGQWPRWNQSASVNSIG